MIQTSHRCCQPVAMLISPMLMASIHESEDNNCLVKWKSYDTLTTLLTTNFIVLRVLQTPVSTIRVNFLKLSIITVLLFINWDVTEIGRSMMTFHVGGV